MVVGRTIWDFIIEAAQNPGIQLAFVILLVLMIAGLMLMLLVFLFHSGFLSVRLRYGALEIAV
jgi:hypothetical protein